MKNFEIYYENDNIYNKREIVGGKAYGLWLLSKLGMNIPEAVIIPSNINYGESVLQKVMLFASQVINKYGVDERFAVRSSGAMEDGDKASFAGMYKTILNVTINDLNEAIEECYRSFNSDRANLYVSALEVELNNNLGMSVIIQRMIKPTYSGVCFTINPINNSFNEMVIEVTNGLGEMLVSGHVTPSYYLVENETGNVIDFEYGENEVGKLTNKLIKLIWGKTSYISKQLNSPLDIEFCIQAETIFFLQARKITTLKKNML